MTIERSMTAEYSAAGHISKGSMEFAFADAWRLAADFDLTRAAFQSGRITPGHVREIIREAQAVRDAISAGDVAPDTLTLYEAAVLEVAEHDTPARTKGHARQIAATLAGLTIVERHKKPAEERTNTVRSVGDGLALLQAVLSEHLALGMDEPNGARLRRPCAPTRHVRALRRIGDGRRTLLTRHGPQPSRSCSQPTECVCAPSSSTRARRPRSLVTTITGDPPESTRRVSSTMASSPLASARTTSTRSCTPRRPSASGIARASPSTTSDTRGNQR